MILSLVAALLILSIGFLEGTLLKGINNLDKFVIKNSVPPLYVEGVRFTVYSLSSLGSNLLKFTTYVFLALVETFGK